MGFIPARFFIMDRKKLLKPIGSLCRKARQQEGYSVAQMAEILNVSKNAVYRFERGHYDTVTFLLVYIYYCNMSANHAQVLEMLLEAKNDE